MRNSWQQAAIGGVVVGAVAWFGLVGPLVAQRSDARERAALAGRLKLAAVPWSGLELERSRPMSSWVVSGAWDAGYNGTYTETGTWQGKPAYRLDANHWLFWAGEVPSVWWLAATLEAVEPMYIGTGPDLAANPWAAIVGTAPAPTVTEGTGGTAPTLAITAPAAGTVSGIVPVTVEWANCPGSTKMLFAQAGGSWLGGSNFVLVDGDSGSLTFNWNTSAHPDGDVVLTALMQGVTGGTYSVAAVPVTVTVDNVGGGGTLDRPPDVSITDPANAATVSGSTVAVSVLASDDNALASVVLYLDKGLPGETTLQTWTTTASAFGGSYVLHTTALTNGAHTLTAVATDSASNTNSATIAIIVSNAGADTTAPTVTITAPGALESVAGVYTVTATITDDVAVASATLDVDGLVQETVTGNITTYTWQLDTRLFANGSRVLTVTALDTSGNSGNDTVTVTFNNTVPDLQQVFYTAELDAGEIFTPPFDRVFETLVIDPADIPADEAAQWNVSVYFRVPGDSVDLSTYRRANVGYADVPSPTGDTIRWAMTRTPRRVWGVWQSGGVDLTRLSVLENGHVLALAAGQEKLLELTGSGFTTFADLAALTAPSDMIASDGKAFVVDGTSLHVYDQDTGELDLTLDLSARVSAINHLDAGDGDSILVSCSVTGGTGALYRFTYPAFTLVSTWTAPLTRACYTASGETLAGDDDGKVLALTSGALALAYDTGEAAAVTCLGEVGSIILCGAGTAGKLFARVGGTWALSTTLAVTSPLAVALFRGWAYSCGDTDDLYRQSVDGSWSDGIDLSGYSVTAVNDMLTLGDALYLATSHASDAPLLRLEIAPEGDIVCGPSFPPVVFQVLEGRVV